MATGTLVVRSCALCCTRDGPAGPACRHLRPMANWSGRASRVPSGSLAQPDATTRPDSPTRALLAVHFIVTCHKGFLGALPIVRSIQMAGARATWLGACYSWGHHHWTMSGEESLLAVHCRVACCNGLLGHFRVVRSARMARAQTTQLRGP